MKSSPKAKFWPFIMVLAALLAAQEPVSAQQTPNQNRPAQPQATPARPAQGQPSASVRDGQVFEDWIANCGSVEGVQGQRCVVSQTLSNERQQRVLRTTMGYLGPNREPAILFELPLGVYLPAGAAVRFDEGAQRPMVFEACVPEGCKAGLILDAPSLQAVRAARSIRIGFLTQAGGETVTLNVSPKGLSAGFAALSAR